MNFLKQSPAYLLGLIFFVFGLDFFIHFMPQQKTMPTGNAGTFAGLLYTTGYLTAIKVFEISFGLLLFIPKTRALAYILIAPICVGILFFEIFIAKQPGIGIILVLLNIVGVLINKEKYLPIIK